MLNLILVSTDEPSDAFVSYKVKNNMSYSILPQTLKFKEGDDIMALPTLRCSFSIFFPLCVFFSFFSFPSFSFLFYLSIAYAAQDKGSSIATRGFNVG